MLIVKSTIVKSGFHCNFLGRRSFALLSTTHQRREVCFSSSRVVGTLVDEPNLRLVTPIYETLSRIHFSMKEGERKPHKNKTKSNSLPVHSTPSAVEKQLLSVLQE